LSWIFWTSPLAEEGWPESTAWPCLWTRPLPETGFWPESSGKKSSMPRPGWKPSCRRRPTGSSRPVRTAVSAEDASFSFSGTTGSLNSSAATWPSAWPISGWFRMRSCIPPWVPNGSSNTATRWNFPARTAAGAFPARWDRRAWTSVSPWAFMCPEPLTGSWTRRPACCSLSSATACCRRCANT